MKLALCTSQHVSASSACLLFSTFLWWQGGALPSIKERSMFKKQPGTCMNENELPGLTKHGGGCSGLQGLETEDKVK